MLCIKSCLICSSNDRVPCRSARSANAIQALTNTEVASLGKGRTARGSTSCIRGSITFASKCPGWHDKVSRPSFDRVNERTRTAILIYCAIGKDSAFPLRSSACPLRRLSTAQWRADPNLSANYLQSGSSDNFGRIIRIQNVINWVEPEKSSFMCIGKYIWESAVEPLIIMIRDFKDGKQFEKHVHQKLGIGNASACLYR